MASDRRDWGLLDVLDAFAAGERSPHVWASASALATLIRRESNAPFGRQRLEQMLSSTQREELGALLRYACYRQLHEHPEARGLASGRHADGSRWVDREAAWAQRLDALSMDAARDHSPKLELVRRALDPSLETPGVMNLAVASMRLSDCAAARNHLVYAEILCGAPSRGLHQAADIVDRAVTAAERCDGYVACGYSASLLGRFQDALQSYRHATMQGALGCVPSFYWLTLSASLGILAEVVEAAWTYAETVDAPETTSELLSTWNASGLAPPLERNADIRSLIAGDLPAEAREVLESILRP